LAAEWKYVPYFNGTYSSTVQQGAGVVATYHTPLTATAPSADELVQNATWKPFKTSAGLKAHWKMYGVEESGFTSVNNVSVTNHGGISFYADGLTPNASYGLGYVSYLVEFRGRK